MEGWGEKGRDRGEEEGHGGGEKERREEERNGEVEGARRLRFTFFPPQNHPLLCSPPSQVLLIILKAHIATYRALKAMPGGSEARVGLVHQHIRFMPSRDFVPHIT
jgi:hypothetical protein